MSRPINLPAGSSRTSDVGLVWREIKNETNPLLQFEIPKYCAVRIHPEVPSFKVYFDGELAATLKVSEVMLFNSGRGLPDGKDTVTLTVSGACQIQIGIEIDRER